MIKYSVIFFSFKTQKIKSPDAHPNEMCCAQICFPGVFLFFIWNITHVHLGFLLSTQLSFITIFLNSLRQMLRYSLKMAVETSFHNLQNSFL
jgi:hypothetical protein